MDSSSGTNPKRLTVVYRDDSCSLILFAGAEPGSLVHALTSRFQLGHLPFHLTYPGDDAVVPLSSALPGGMTLELHVGSQAPLEASIGVAHIHNSSGEFCETRAAASNAVTCNSSLDPVLTTRSFLESGSDDQNYPRANISMRIISPGVTEDMAGGPQASATGSAAPLLEHQAHHVQLPIPTGGSNPSSRRSGSRTSLHHCSGVRTPNSCASGDHDNEGHSAIHGLEAMEEVARCVDRFSRLTSELSNERTLLAWVRTGLAAVRTAFGFFELKASGYGWKETIILSQVAMMTVVLFAGVSGTLRYNKVKSALRLPEPPAEFGRVSIGWFNSLVLVSTIGIAAGIYTQSWT